MTALMEKLRDNALRTAHLTDAGNAERLVTLHAEKLRYVHDAKRWHVWDGVSWAPDRTGEAARLARDSATQTLLAAATWSENVSDEDKGKLVKHALASENAQKLRAALEVAQSHAGLAALVEDFDTDPWSLNVANGIVDLKTGELRPHDPAEMHSKVANAGLTDATAPLWTAFLEQVLPDAEVRRYFQKLCGYSLSGDIGENVLPFAHGSGANGKSVAFAVLRYVLGDYASEGPPDLLMQRNSGEEHPTVVAALRGRRFVTTQEVDAGRKLDIGRMKRLTGEPTLNARRMYQDYSEFVNVSKVWMAANDKPEMDATDDAAWRRVRLIPFEVTIPEAERNSSLATELQAEADGILRWMVDGAMLYQQEKLLPIPEAVQLATDEYRDESNPLADWIGAYCVLDPDAHTAATDLRKSYEAWQARYRRNEPKVTKGKRWHDGLGRLGLFERKGTGGIRVFDGVALKSDAAGADF